MTIAQYIAHILVGLAVVFGLRLVPAYRSWPPVRRYVVLALVLFFAFGILQVIWPTPAPVAME